MEHTEETASTRGDFPITDADVKSGFKYEVAHKIGGEGVLRCLKCGACSGGCPVGSVIDYRARKILGNVLLGLKDQVLLGEDLWLCAACFTCEERCVQEVNFTDVITVLRNMASREGNAAPGYVAMAKMVMENGRVSKATRQVDRMREQLGLPPIQEPAMDQLRRILESSRFHEVIEASERRDEAK